MNKRQAAGVQLKIEQLDARCLLTGTTYTIYNLGFACSIGTKALSYGTTVFDGNHLAGRSTDCKTTPMQSDYQAAFSGGIGDPIRLGTITNSQGSGSTSGARGLYTSLGNPKPTTS